jgi:hypothetical protein
MKTMEKTRVLVGIDSIKNYFVHTNKQYKLYSQ